MSGAEGSSNTHKKREREEEGVVEYNLQVGALLLEQINVTFLAPLGARIYICQVDAHSRFVGVHRGRGRNQILATFGNTISKAQPVIVPLIKSGSGWINHAISIDNGYNKALCEWLRGISFYRYIQYLGVVQRKTKTG